MTQRTLTRLFDSHEDATATVRALEAAGFSRDDISIVAHNDHARYYISDKTGGGEAGAEGGAVAGTIIGGGLGLLAGIGSLAIPGVGPVVAAGWLVATITGAGAGAAVGAGAGGLLGALTSAGVPERDAHVYAEGVRRGGTLVNVRVEESRAAEAERILNNHAYVDPTQRRTEYEGTGWTRFDETRPAYTPDTEVPLPRRTGTI